MKYLITEGKSDAQLICALFKKEIDKNSWIVTPMSGGQSEAISLAESLAYRHRKEGKILLITDSDAEDNENYNINRIKSRCNEYNNVCIVFAVPNLEAEIIKVLKLDAEIPNLARWNVRASKNIVRNKAIEVINRPNYKVSKTEFYKKIKACLQQSAPKLQISKTGLLIEEEVKTVGDLKSRAEAAQEGVSTGRLTLLNRDVVLLMKIDALIRNAAIDEGIQGLDDQYFKSNLSPLPGKTVVEKTRNYIKFLESQGESEAFTGPDYGLRNLKHIFDKVPDRIVESELPKINKEIKQWLERK